MPQISAAAGEFVTDPLKPTQATSYFQIFLVCAIAGPALVMFWLWAARVALSPDDAATFKSCVLGLWAVLTGGSGGASLIGGLQRTAGKIAFQKMAVQMSPAAPEGVGGDSILGNPDESPNMESIEGEEVLQDAIG